MNGEDLANKTGLGKNNRFIFADSYYENMPEIPEKPNFDSAQFPNTKEVSFNTYNMDKNNLLNTGKESTSTHSSLNSNFSVQQASSIDQLIRNDYEEENSNSHQNVFNFFVHKANTVINDNNLSEQGNSELTELSVDEKVASREKNHFFGRFVPKKNKNSELEVVHVGKDIPTSNVLATESDLKGSSSSENSYSVETQGTLSENSLPSNSIQDGFHYPSNENLANLQNVSNVNSDFPKSSTDISDENSSSNYIQSFGDFTTFDSMTDQNKFPNREENKGEVDSYTNPLSSIFSENESEKPLIFSAESTDSRSVKDRIKDSSADLSFVTEPFRNNDFSSFQNYSNKKEKSSSPQVSKEETGDIDFIERLKKQEFPQGGLSSLDDNISSLINSNSNKKDFLLEIRDKDAEVKIPERKLEYESFDTNSDFSNQMRFIINGDPSIKVDSAARNNDLTKIPDFMSGTVQVSNLNIETGINHELEAELLKQREAEQEQKRLENSEYRTYHELSTKKPKQEIVYKAGGKSYVREVVKQPKFSTKKNDTSSKSGETLKEESFKNIKYGEQTQPRSIEEMIESIVGVPGLSNIEVKLNPFENPGVKFGFREKEKEKIIEGNQPTTVYDEKKDNFDYDQNFDNVEVIKSNLLSELVEKSKKEGKISILARYGEDFCARDYVTNPAIGRAEEMKQLILILLTPEKSGILIGKPGIGKTSIVEGIAYQLQRNNVPEALKGFRIVSVKTSSLLGSLPTGETRLQTLVDELKELDKIILFIDEIHMLIGATSDSAMDFANMFKESLGRGTIKVLGATTTEEYERYILRDKAFVRRFQKVEVEEPSREHTIKILMGTLPKIEKNTGAKLKYSEFMKTEIMAFIVDITTEYKRIYGIGSRYPDICLTLLSQAFSQTVFANRTEVTINDIRKAIENSKNIYPDVIRKELVNFDLKFKDLIREEE